MPYRSPAKTKIRSSILAPEQFCKLYSTTCIFSLVVRSARKTCGADAGIFLLIIFLFLLAGAVPAQASDTGSTRLDVFFAQMEGDILHPPKRKKLYRADKGPWGDIEYYATYLEPPDWMVKTFPLRAERTEWHFPEHSVAQSREKLLAAGFDAVDLLWIDEPNRQEIKDGMTTLYPPDEFVENLAPERRLALLELLGKWPANKDYHDPSVIVGDDPKVWMKSYGVSAEIIALALKCSYKRGRQLLFSDTPLLMSRAKTLEEKRAVMKMLSRQYTLVARLRIGDNADVNKIKEYWSAGYKHKDVLTMLNSVTENDEVEVLDIVHLLPPLPRKLLYTYPSINNLSEGKPPPDCHWTSLSFFNYYPSSELLDADFWVEIKSRYVEVEGSLKFGDIIIFNDIETHEVLHSSVYVAADLVFTKNGSALDRPWILMRLSDLASIYMPYSGNAIEGVAVFRLRQ